MTTGYNYIIDTGTIVADTSTLLTDVQDEWKASLGANLNVDASTLQGGLIQGDTIARTNTMKNNADLANVFNPALSYGTFLDAICSLLGVSRGKNKSTVGDGALFSGDATTFIPSGSRISTGNDDVFVTFGDVTIPGGGTIRGQIKSVAFGQVPLPLGEMTIIDGTIGFGGVTIDGSTNVTLGSVALNDPRLKSARNAQLAIQGVGGSASIKAAASALANVDSANVVENNTGAPGTINGVTFTLNNSTWVCVSGVADPADVALALYIAHNGGTPWEYGATGQGVPVGAPNGISVIDPSTGLTYRVKYTTPILYDAYVNITVRGGGSVAASVPSIQRAIVDYADGNEDGEDGLVVGADVSAFEISGAVARNFPGLYVKSCMVAIVPKGNAAPAFPADYSTEAEVTPFQQAVLQIGNVVVNPI